MTLRFRILTIALSMLPLPAMAQSVFSFYQPQDVVFKTELLGQWSIEEAATVEFRDAGNRTYGIILSGLEGDEQVIARARLIYLGGRYFLDVQALDLRFPQENKEKSQDANGISFDSQTGFLTRLHGLILISFSEPDKFTGTLWNERWLPAMAGQKRLKIPYLKDEAGRILLTAESSQLRLFVAKLPKEAFDGESGVLRRIPAGPPKAVKEPSTSRVLSRLRERANR